jgi:tetratricopeptide (TPR) repeat protein
MPAAAQTADPQQLCGGSQTTADDWVKGCSAIIDSGQAHGRDLAAAYAQRGFAFTLKRNLDQAQKDLDQAINLAPDYAPGYVNRANFWTVSNQPQRAMADAERALRLEPDLPLAFFVLAGAESKLGLYDRAIADYSEMLRLRPDSGATIYAPRGYAYYRKGDYDHAIADYDEWIKLSPNEAGAYLNRGDALRSKNELARAADNYARAIRLAPDNPGGWKGRGTIRLLTHDFAGAVADFDTAIRLNPSESVVYLNRGTALLLLGENLRALSDNDKVLDLEPNQPLAFVNRGLAMHGLGDDAGALAAIKGALELAPGFRPALDALQQIGAAKDAAQSHPAKARPSGDLNPSECMIPVADIQLDPKSVDRVLQACTSLINSGGGSADDRSLAFLQRGSCIGGSRSTNWPWPILTSLFATIPNRPTDTPGAAMRCARSAASTSPSRLTARRSASIQTTPWPTVTAAMLLAIKKDYEHAIADFDTAIKIDAKYATAFYNRGNIKLDAGDKPGAIADYRQALALRPGFKEPANLLKQLGAN